MSEPAGRLRTHPSERFDPPQLRIDLGEIESSLRAESLPDNRLHRQQTLYRHGPLTIALFLFQAGASMPQHVAEGVVTVHVLAGRLRMSAEGQVHDLPAGAMLVLAPGIKHDVQAIEASKMLLTVCLQGD